MFDLDTIKKMNRLQDPTIPADVLTGAKDIPDLCHRIAGQYLRLGRYSEARYFQRLGNKASEVGSLSVAMSLELALAVKNEDDAEGGEGE